MNTHQPIDKNLAIMMPAYNAGKTIESVFERIPTELRSSILHYIVVNDGSTDNTPEALARLQVRYPNLVVIDHKRNQGYGSAEKTLLRFAATTEAKIFVVLHADGQYAPEELPHLIKPLVEERADIVQGSRMADGGLRALKGSMPFYKYLANRALSAIQNFAFEMQLAEYHSGYMLYSKRVLTEIPFEKLSDSFCFDQEMLVMGKIKGLRIVEVPIPTFYGDEVSHLKPIQYGCHVLAIVWEFKRGHYHAL